MEQQQLVIDPEFQGKIPPLTQAEFDQLEANILADGEVSMPIIVWNGVIIDGHNRWKIIKKHPEIPYRTKEMHFSDKWEAFDWMYKNQLGRRNLTNEQKTYLLGKLYEARKKTVGKHTGNQYTKMERRQSDAIPTGRVREQIMREQGVGQKTVERAEVYAKGIDAIRDEEPELASEILNAQKKVSKADVRRIGTADKKSRKEMIRKVKTGEKLELDPEDRKEMETAAISLTEERVMDYTIDNLVEQIKVNADSFIRSLSNLLIDHIDICNESSPTIIKAVDEYITDRLYQIKERLNNGTQL